MTRSLILRLPPRRSGRLPQGAHEGEVYFS